MNGSVILWEQQWVNRASSHSVALGESLTVCKPRVVGRGIRRWVLEVAAAAWLLLLCFNVFMNLELGLIGMLDGPVLQFPEEQNQTSHSLQNSTYWLFYLNWMHDIGVVTTINVKGSFNQPSVKLKWKCFISHCSGVLYIVVINKNQHLSLLGGIHGSRKTWKNYENNEWFILNSSAVSEMMWLWLKENEWDGCTLLDWHHAFSHVNEDTSINHTENVLFFAYFHFWSFFFV